MKLLHISIIFFNINIVSALSFVVVIQLLSCVWLFATHGLQHITLPCPSLSPEFAQTHVHWVSDAFSSSVIPFFLCPLSFLHQGLFHWVSFLHLGIILWSGHLAVNKTDTASLHILILHHINHRVTWIPIILVIIAE